jgi:hypothetical protein
MKKKGKGKDEGEEEEAEDKVLGQKKKKQMGREGERADVCAGPEEASFPGGRRMVKEEGGEEGETLMS